MAWNFNIDEAPKDHPIIAASVCGIVTKSYWIAEGQRWNMFTKESKPIAWQLWPDHPNPSAKVKPKKAEADLENMFD
jgi:hypothetical protein